MSRGFVKEDDLEHAGTDLPEKPISPHPNYVTPTGLSLLEQAAKLLDIERVELSGQHLDDASTKQRLAVIDRDLRYLSARIKDAIIVNPDQQDKETVLFGATVDVEDEDGKTQQFMIVGEDEASTDESKVSYVSPIAKALIGRKLGDVAIWKRPAGDIEIEIINIKY